MVLPVCDVTHLVAANCKHVNSDVALIDNNPALTFLSSCSCEQRSRGAWQSLQTGNGFIESYPITYWTGHIWTQNFPGLKKWSLLFISLHLVATCYFGIIASNISPTFIVFCTELWIDHIQLYRLIQFSVVPYSKSSFCSKRFMFFLSLL